MSQQFELEVPSNTLEGTPVSRTYDIGSPVVRSILVHIPAGHKYLARLRVLSRGQQILPTPGSDPYIRGNDMNKTYPVNRRLEGPPYQITLQGWSEDDTYPHTFFVEVQ